MSKIYCAIAISCFFSCFCYSQYDPAKELSYKQTEEIRKVEWNSNYKNLSEENKNEAIEFAKQLGWWLDYYPDGVPYEIDSQGNLIFTRIIKFEEQSKNELFNYAKTYIVDNYSGRLWHHGVDDKELGRYGRSAVTKKFHSSRKITVDLHYYMQVDVKDGKAKLKLKCNYYKYSSSASKELKFQDLPPISAKLSNYKFYNRAHALIIMHADTYFKEFEEYVKKESNNEW